jgi:hypothetical protein
VNSSFDITTKSSSEKNSVYNQYDQKQGRRQSVKNMTIIQAFLQMPYLGVQEQGSLVNALHHVFREVPVLPG